MALHRELPQVCNFVKEGQLLWRKASKERCWFPFQAHVASLSLSSLFPEAHCHTKICFWTLHQTTATRSVFHLCNKITSLLWLPCKSNTPSVPIRVFSVENCTAGNIPAEKSVPNPAVGLHTLYREQERRKRVLGWQRTHKDPFEGKWEQVMAWLVANPERSSGDIFRELQRRSPEPFQPLQIRTLQRGMQKIRAHLLQTFGEQCRKK